MILKTPRFIIEYGDDPEYKMLTRSSDGQLMFLVNKLMKMKTSSKLGSRIAQVHNGSSLFTGDAGQGESNIRRWIIENDWLEAIIALPENIFYNTGISTYIWVLTNQKSKERKGKVQLIDATHWYQSLRKNMGKKNCELNESHIQNICKLISQPEETEQSKIFTNEAFGYYKVIVELPLRLKSQFTKKRVEQLRDKKKLHDIAKEIFTIVGEEVFTDYNLFMDKIDSAMNDQDIKATAGQKKTIARTMSEIDESAEAVIKKSHKKGKIEANPLYGLYETTINGKKVVVEYEPDTNLRDSEQVPLLEDGGIPAFIEREVLPYTPDAWVDKSKTQIGYEISFTKHFYKPIPMRTLDEIKADIFAIEQETEGLLEEIIGDSKG